VTDAYVLKALTPLRRVIAARMTEAKQTIPHFRLVSDVCVDELLKLRQELSADMPDRKVSLNDLIVKACGSALMDTPAINIQWSAEGIRQFESADIAIAAAIEGGVVTPIVRGVERKSIGEISAEIRGLVDRARNGALAMSEVMGGTFTISNLGMHAVDQFDAIINAPQCAILAIGRAKCQAVVAVDGRIALGHLAKLTLSVDHRAIDGVTAGLFLSALCRRIEDPSYMRTSAS
jgi:pyruvate dehydrogenase E2 component (dihydrolipoamide acetyltransferase)